MSPRIKDALVIDEADALNFAHEYALEVLFNNQGVVILSNDDEFSGPSLVDAVRKMQRRISGGKAVA